MQLYFTQYSTSVPVNVRLPTMMELIEFYWEHFILGVTVLH
jgi:uncharacterized membrane protein